MDTDPTPEASALYTVQNLASCTIQQPLGYLIVHVKRRLGEIMEQQLEPLELTAAQFVVIIHLVHQPDTTPAEFSRILDYDPGAMTRLLDRIEKKGFIRRVQNPQDRRSVRLELTESGMALYPKILPKICNAYNQLLHGFSQDEARLLESMLQRILSNN